MTRLVAICGFVAAVGFLGYVLTENWFVATGSAGVAMIVLALLLVAWGNE